MLAPYFRKVLLDEGFQHNWRWWVSTMFGTGMPVDAISASLAFFDTYRTGRLPANMIQAQRDKFGEHGFERTDKPGKGFHLSPR
jgi:6-phosphogluconate dehydrogenase